VIDSASTTRRHPTILDVASHAGVSKSTVSNVVRGLPGVSEATRRRVRLAIDELGYRPNVLARQLVQPGLRRALVAARPEGQGREAIGRRGRAIGDDPGQQIAPCVGGLVAQ